MTEPSARLFPERAAGSSRYPYGFVVGRSLPAELPRGWCQKAWPTDFKIAFDTDQPCGSVNDGDSAVLIIGPAVDTEAPRDDEQVLAAAALRALQVGERDLWRLLDTWAGRFAMLYCKDGRTNLLHDAVGLRSVFVGRLGDICAASHALLITTWQDLPRRPDIAAIEALPGFKQDVFHHPGDATPWEGLTVLIPNHVVSLDTGRVRRFYPREPRSQLSCEAAAQQAASLIRGVAEAFAARYPLMVSLSGGWDSRASLAAVRPWIHDVVFFTYFRPDRRSLEVDRALTRQLRDELELSHTELTPTEPVDRQQRLLARDMALNNHLAHGRNLVLSFREHLPAGRVHLRSSYFAIGRAHHRRKFARVYSPGSAHSGLDARAAARLFKDVRGDRDLELDRSAQVTGIFEQFLDEQEFPTVATLGYDPSDFFLWEHRLGCRHSCVVLETDIAHPTLTLFGHRQLLDTMLRVPVADRYFQRLPRRIIEILWPDVLRVPINRLRPPALAERLRDRWRHRRYRSGW